MPELKACLITCMSETVSAISINSGSAFRPVMMMLRRWGLDLERSNDPCHRQKIELRQIGQLIQDKQIVGVLGNNFFGQGKPLFGNFSVFFELFFFENEPFAADVPVQILKLLCQQPFTVFTLAFDKLDHTDFLAVPERPERSSQRRRCFSFAITGIDNDTSFYCHNLTLEKVLDNEPLNTPRPMLPDTSQ